MPVEKQEKTVLQTISFTVTTGDKILRDALDYSLQHTV